MIDNTGTNENIGEDETEVNVESLRAEIQNVEEPVTTAREAEAAAKPSQERTEEASSSSDSDDLFEDNETTILMRRSIVLEEDKIFKDAQIASLMEESVHKNQKFQELETNLGSLAVVVTTRSKN
ncbi:hypothetical protein Hanom_Chr04g00344971 [Helianthus anomalus]